MVGRWVQQAVGKPVASEEIGNRHPAGVVGWRDHQRTPRTGLDEVDAAQDKRPRDPLPQRRVGDDKRAQGRRVEPNDLGVLGRGAINECGSARQPRSLADERSWAVLCDRGGRAGRVAPGDDNAARHHDEKTHSRVTGPEERLPLREPYAVAEGGGACALGVVEDGEHIAPSNGVRLA